MSHIILLKTIPFRLSKSVKGGLLFKLYEMLEGTSVGNIKIKKNLGDLITTFSVKG